METSPDLEYAPEAGAAETLATAAAPPGVVKIICRLPPPDGDTPMTAAECESLGGMVVPGTEFVDPDDGTGLG